MGAVPAHLLEVPLHVVADLHRLRTAVGGIDHHSEVDVIALQSAAGDGHHPEAPRIVEAVADEDDRTPVHDLCHRQEATEEAVVGAVHLEAAAAVGLDLGPVRVHLAVHRTQVVRVVPPVVREAEVGVEVEGAEACHQHH